MSELTEVVIPLKGNQQQIIQIVTFPLIAGNLLRPGQHIGIKDNKYGCASAPHIGIVDPFLKQTVLTNQIFWMWLYPDARN